MKNNRILSSIVLASALTLPAFTNGCSGNPIDAVCCTEFKPGTDMSTVDFKADAAISGEFHAFAQASGDMSVVAGGALTDVMGACRAIAIDIDGTESANPGAAGKSGADLMTFWCGEAKAKIGASLTATVGGSANLTLDISPPSCSASITATASCQGSCDASAKCDVKANPPTCTGGELEVDCKGGCTAMTPGVAFDCTGSCDANCTGSCEASGGVAVDCTGKCDGTCTAGGSGSGSGIQADGSCKGTCSGKCTIDATAPKVKCSGTCTGKCEGKCTAAVMGGSAKCSGKCDVTATPLECKGGKLEGGCMVSADCKANCNASASATATCTPPTIKIAIKAGANVTVGAEGQFNVLINTLEKNLPQLVLVVKARGDTFAGEISAVAEGGATLTASGKLDLHGTGCIVAMGAAAVQASTDFAATLKASVDVTASVGM